MTILSPGIDVLAGIDRGDAQFAREGRPDGFLVDQGRLLGHQRLLALQIRAVGIDRRLAHGLNGELLLVPLVDGLSQLCCRLERMKLGDIRIGIELDQQPAGLDDVAGLEVQGPHKAADLARHVDAANGPQASHRPDPRLPGLDLGLHRGNRHRGDLSRHGFLHPLLLPGLVTEDDAEDHTDHHQHDDHVPELFAFHSGHLHLTVHPLRQGF